MRYQFIFLTVLFLAVPCAGQRASDALFREKVAPLFTKHCIGCHNRNERKGEFSIQSIDDLRDSGFIEAGDSANSHLMNLIRSSENQIALMPKDGSPLSAGEVDVIRRWIDSGAMWPDDFSIELPKVDDFEWWSLEHITRPDVPEFTTRSDRDWVGTPVDAFVLSRLKSIGMTPSGQADRRTLIRRVTYDLTGLPPSPREVSDFVKDEDPKAFEKLVDRLLHSERYGEHWARHWLDIARYADTCGYDKDKLRPNAWPYRDYVIRSFNEDKPYARFVKEQIAGDVLYPGTSDGILGLGFIAAGPWDFIGHSEVPESKIDGMEARNLDRDEMASSVLNVFCSTTVQCARCHNHKFDPITQEHYYSLQSVFAAVDRADRPYDQDPTVERERERLSNSIALIKEKQASLEREILEAGGARLQVLQKQIKELKARADLKTHRKEFGFHSAITKDPKNSKWVEVDLGREVEIAEVILYPCHDDFAEIGAGFGFPKRFRVSVSSSHKADPHILKSYTDEDLPNPGLTPVRVVPKSSIRARFVRVTATRLAERKRDFVFALSELRVLDPEGNNVALDQTVSSLDSIEAPVRWRRSNLVDGLWPEFSDSEASLRLASVEREKSELLAKINTPARRKFSDQLASELKQAEAKIGKLSPGRMVYAAATKFKSRGNFKPTNGNPRRIRVLHRGNVQQPRQDVKPGTIQLGEDGQWQFRLDQNHDEGERRAALAQWIADHKNPLTWRSVANRIWQYHFGRGIVETPNDFGRMGQLPTHPRLLDWLAAEFRDGGGSFRRLHRLIVLSSTYQQVSTIDRGKSERDVENRYLGRMNRHRLTAEELRDSVLSVSGRLNTKMGGPGYYLFKLEKTAHSPHYEYHLFDPEDEQTHRRSVYRFVVRSQPDPFMTTLDCADSSQSTPRRIETLTALQALSLLNNRFMLTMSEHFADRIETEASSLDDQIRLAFQLLLQRNPTVQESKQLAAYASKHGISNMCRILFNLSEFAYVD